MVFIVLPSFCFTLVTPIPEANLALVINASKPFNLLPSDTIKVIINVIIYKHYYSSTVRL